MTSINNIPEYLKKEYVEKVLKEYFKAPGLQVINIETSPGTAKGESYCSVMTRIKVIYKINGEEVLKQIQLMVKSSFEDDPYCSDVLRQYDVFNTEMEMYEIVLPQLQQMLYEIGDMDQLCAKAIHVDYDRDVIIFEDLTLRNFVTANRLVGLDKDHLKFCLRKLAKMHAAAAVLNERQSGSLEKYSHGIYNRHVNCYGGFLENIMKVSAAFAESCPELGVYYRDKLKQLTPYAVEYVTRCFDANPKHFLTLNHGDIWTNNLMFQYNLENGKANIKDVLLIDFQYCSWSSPAVDLHYFFTTSSQDDQLLHYQPKLIQYYHRVLSQTLEKLKYKQHIPTLHELNIQLLENGYYALSCTLVNLPLLINNKNDDADFESILGNDTKAQRFHNVLYSNKRVQKIVKTMLPRFDTLGLLDVHE